MAIKDAIQTINRMQSDSVIERYAIGDAVGASFYLEPVATIDAETAAGTAKRLIKKNSELRKRLS